MDPADLMVVFLEIVRHGPHPVYLLIAEHDNFANDLIAQGREDLYRGVLHASGFVREFYKRIKTAADNGIIARIFITGVSPVMADDMTSAFNIANPISQDEDFHDLCGFRQSDVEQILDSVAAERGLRIGREQVLEDLRRYYDGYRFTPDAREPLYNPNMVLSFMLKLRPDRYPEHLLDMNIRMDYSRLHRMFFAADGAPRRHPIAQIEQLIGQGEIVAWVYDRFRLDEAYDEKYFASYLYYLGLVTLAGESEGRQRLRVPNLAIRLTYGEALDHILKEAGGVQVSQDQLAKSVGAMAFRGEAGPFCDLLYDRVIRHLSNRDLIRMDEKGLKVLVLAYLGLVDLFHPFTELELGQGYSDLVLALNRRHPQARFGYVIELKYVKETAPAETSGVGRVRGRKTVPGKKDDQAARPRRKSAAQLGREVEARFEEAEAQLQRYMKDPRLQGLRATSGWKALTLVQVGIAALYYRSPGDPARQAGGANESGE